MICRKHKFVTSNKKSFSNHMRWCTGLMNNSSFKNINLGNKNGMWRGNKVGLSALHGWVKQYFNKPKKCNVCGIKNGTIDLANISQKYKRDFNDWEWLCRKCHMNKDGRLIKLHCKRKVYAVPTL